MTLCTRSMHPAQFVHFITINSNSMLQHWFFPCAYGTFVTIKGHSEQCISLVDLHLLLVVGQHTLASDAGTVVIINIPSSITRICNVRAKNNFGNIIQWHSICDLEQPTKTNLPSRSHNIQQTKATPQAVVDKSIIELGRHVGYQLEAVVRVLFTASN